MTLLDFPTRIYYEPDIFEYKLGKYLKEKYADREWVEIESHNNIPSLRANENTEFANMKNLLIIGTRKTHKYVENHKVSDYLVPYTSSGCSAYCLYCYLVCNYNKCSYLRVFVNREQMMTKLLKNAAKLNPETGKEQCFEIGSNSDLVLENTITNNLPWTIEQFSYSPKGKITFPTKFDMVDPLLPVNHRGKTIFRMSVNPQYIISNVEFKTSPLVNRIQAVNKMCDADYPIGLLIAPVILVDNWKELYKELIIELADKLSAKVKKTAFIEIIFMTYSFVHTAINGEAFPNAINLYDKNNMKGGGRGKYRYLPALKEDGEIYLRDLLHHYLPDMNILYVV